MAEYRKYKFFFFYTIFVSYALSSMCVYADSQLFKNRVATHIEMNNRVLANVNGKPISVYDVMKKMDVLFYQQFPQFASSTEARHQYYQMNWKRVLQELIDMELIRADAEELNLPVSHGDIRQEMETMFGPNIIGTLDKMGLSMDEAAELVKGDVLLRRMVYLRVRSKAENRVTPQAIHDAYETYAKENAIPAEWTYRVVSIRDKDEKRGAEAAQLAYKLLASDQVPLESLQDNLQRSGIKKSKVAISDAQTHNQKEINPKYYEVLKDMTKAAYSTPSEQKSRSGKGKVYRIFYLLDYKEGGEVPFSEVENNIKNQLMNKAMDIETIAYIKRLREHFHVQDDDIMNRISDDFQPFELK